MAFERRVSVIRISVPWIVESVNAINDLDKISSEGQKPEIFGVLFMAQNKLSQLYIQSFYKDRFKSSCGPANALYSIIDEILGNYPVDKPVATHSMA
jgi:hypothetical protein